MAAQAASFKDDNYLRQPDKFGTIIVLPDSFYGTEKLPPTDSIRAGVNFGYNNSQTGTLSISTEQWT